MPIKQIRADTNVLEFFNSNLNTYVFYTRLIFKW